MISRFITVCISAHFIFVGLLVFYVLPLGLINDDDSDERLIWLRVKQRGIAQPSGTPSLSQVGAPSDLKQLFFCP